MEKSKVSRTWVEMSHNFFSVDIIYFGIKWKNLMWKFYDTLEWISVFRHEEMEQ